MSQDNHGFQQGNNSINIGTGNFRNANINVNTGDEFSFTSEQIKIKRYRKFKNPIFKIEKPQNLDIFAIVTGLASLVGLYFTLFTPLSVPSSWSTFFYFIFAICWLSYFLVIIAKVVKQRKFTYFFNRKYYLEMGSEGGVYLTSFAAVCPWCDSRMNLRTVKILENLREDIFICERNPKQHNIELDPTTLPDIVE